MFIDTKNFYTCLTADSGMMLSNGKFLAKQVFIPLSANADEWSEVSEFVIMTPQEQQKRLTELEQKRQELEQQVTDYENRWNSKVALRARVDELGKEVQGEEPDGSYLSPIPYTDGMEVTEGLWYLFQDPEDPMNPNKWECKKSGIPSSADDDEYFDIIK